MTPDLNAQIYQRLHPRAYFERFLAEQVRPDSREAEEWRDIFVHVGSISTADGSALVRLGETTIVCGVKAEIAEPDLERPTEGFIGMCLSLLQYIAERLQSRILTFRLCAHRDSNRDPHPRRHRYFRTDLHQQSLRASSLPFTSSPLTSQSGPVYSRSRRYASTPSVQLGCCTSTRRASTMTEMRLTPRSSQWLLRSKTVRSPDSILRCDSDDNC